VSDDLREPAPASAAHGPTGEGRRRSACANDARARESRRILALTPTERALLALDLGDRYATWSKGTP
jgi:hypothetical protein